MSLNHKILLPEVQQFVDQHLKADLNSLLLKKSPFAEISMRDIAQQIKGRQVAEKKFPSLVKEGVLFPPQLNLEQTSSEITARYKAQGISGKSIVDLTSGFGIDAYFLSKYFDKITLVEQNSELLELVKHNWSVLGLDKKAEFVSKPLNDFLEENSSQFDWVYLDPARRNSEKKKVFLLEDLSPNLLEIQEKLTKISNKILLKLSPLIDLKYLISAINNVVEIKIVAVKNEVKEILVVIDHSKANVAPLCTCINLETDEPQFQFYFDEDNKVKTQYSAPEQYLYIPNNAILKSGAFNKIAETFALKKLHQNTHFYTSNEKINSFPGRVLKIDVIDNKQIIKGEYYNIISKNHPLKPEEIKKKYKIKDGGSQYLIFTQTQKGKIILKSK